MEDTFNLNVLNSDIEIEVIYLNVNDPNTNTFVFVNVRNEIDKYARFRNGWSNKDVHSIL